MLQMLTRRGFADVVAVVTRYFGGALLGAGGLVARVRRRGGGDAGPGEADPRWSPRRS